MTLSVQAYAKVNLTLEALAKRDDGYHEIVSVLQTISLTDSISFDSNETLEFFCDVPGLQTENNLVLRAARLLGETTSCQKGATIHLTKRIPIAAGLGSGATDAAYTLVALDRLWGTNMPFPRLLELAAELGSDVSFFLHGGTALTEGRGEIVTPLPSVPEMWLVLLIPPIDVADKTAQLYAQLKNEHFTSRHITRTLVENINKWIRPDASMLYNVFEHVAFDFYSGLSDYCSIFTSAGAAGVHMAGAGPALFAIVSDKAKGEAILSNLKVNKHEAYLVSTVNSTPLADGGDS
jgi:4-diphosphocytidyl-2-C-methyl-D-erythritol kinase